MSETNELAVKDEVAPPAPVSQTSTPALSYSDQEMMAMADFADKVCAANLLPDHLKKKPADCLLVLMQARRWGMDFFAVAQCTSVEKGKMMYEGKLVHAALLASGAITEPFHYKYSQDDENDLWIRVTGTLPSGEKREVTLKLGDVRTFGRKRDGTKYKNAWDKQPKTQLAYRGAREWARLYAPHIMLGVVAEGEELPQDEPEKKEVKLASGKVVGEEKKESESGSEESVAHPHATQGDPVEGELIPHETKDEQPTTSGDVHWTDVYPDDWRQVAIPPQLGLAGKELVNDLTKTQIRGFRDKFEVDLTAESKVFRAALDASYMVEAMGWSAKFGHKSEEEFYQWAVENEVMDDSSGFEDLDAAQLKGLMDVIHTAYNNKKKAEKEEGKNE